MVSTTNRKEQILSHIDAIGGAYVWEDDIFTVTLLDVEASDADAALLAELTGVQQIAIDASRLSFSALQTLARLPDLQSLVLSGAGVSSGQLESLRLLCPEVIIIEDD